MTASEVAGYELGHFIKTGRFVPWNVAQKRIENTSTKGFLFNIPYELGVKTGGQLAQAGGSIIANTIPITGTFGHLFAHPNESIWDKASDIAFGVLDIAGIGDVIQAVKKPVEEGINVIENTLAKRITSLPLPKLPPPPQPFILPLPRLPFPTIHLPHIDIHPPDLVRLAKTITGDEHAVVTGIQDWGKKLAVIIGDAVTHLLNVDKGLGKIEHYILHDSGRLIKVGEYTEGDIAKLLGKDLRDLGGGIKGFFGKLNRILHSKPVTYGLLGIAVGAPLAGSLLTGGTGGTQQQTSPSSPYPSSPSPYPSLPPYISPVRGGGTSQSSQSADVLNPTSPQAQYYSALASQTAQTQSTTTQSTTSSSTTSSKGSLFSNPLLWVGIAIFIIIIIVLLVR